jgi:hypothetical protein
VLLGREFGWTLDEMRQLTPRELTAILSELERQVALEQLNEQRNRWNFLAAVIMNGASVLTSAIAGAVGKRKKLKMVEPDDFMSEDSKKLFQQLLAQGISPDKNKDGWEPYIQDAKAKGLTGPWVKE